MDIKKPQLVKVGAFAYFFEGVLQHPLRKTKLSGPGVCRTPIEANKETTNPPKNVKLTFLIPLIHN